MHEGVDFKAKLTRQDLDDLVTDVYDRVSKPVEDALKMAEMTPVFVFLWFFRKFFVKTSIFWDQDKIDYVILMGGGTRSQKVQEKLQAAVGGSVFFTEFLP